MNLTRRHLLGTAAAMAVAHGIPVFAQAWPARPVRLVSPYGAGGSSDILTRLLGEGTPDHAAVSLISASLDAGSSDNITVVVADLVDDDAVDEQAHPAASIPATQASPVPS